MGSLWPSLFELTIFWCRLQLRSASTVLSLSESAEDMPLTLATTERWPHADPHITIWEIVAELVSRCITPTPTNPFEIAADTLEGAWMGLPPTMRGEAMTATEGLELTDLERALNYGAVASLLHEIFLSDAPYAPHGMQALCLMQLAPHTLTSLLGAHGALAAELNASAVCCGTVADDMRRCTERHFQGMADLLNATSPSSDTFAST